jgi:hypothetical protein
VLPDSPAPAPRIYGYRYPLTYFAILAGLTFLFFLPFQEHFLPYSHVFFWLILPLNAFILSLRRYKLKITNLENICLTSSSTDSKNSNFATKDITKIILAPTWIGKGLNVLIISSPRKTYLSTGVYGSAVQPFLDWIEKKRDTPTVFEVIHLKNTLKLHLWTAKKTWQRVLVGWMVLINSLALVAMPVLAVGWINACDA